MKLNEHGSNLRHALPLLLAATCSTDAEEFALDYRVKASYLLNLLRFIDWPHDVCDPHGQLNLSICGADGLDAYYALHDEPVGGRTLYVERIRDIGTPSTQERHILVLGGDKPVQSVPIMRGLLTVGEADAFAARGGILNLLLIGGRVRFEINEEMAKACGFVIDPKLSKLKVPAWYSANVR